jgi:hypothetical protein
MKKGITHGSMKLKLQNVLHPKAEHPTWLPIFTACQPLKALATYSSVVPGATAVMRLYKH